MADRDIAVCFARWLCEKQKYGEAQRILQNLIPVCSHALTEEHVDNFSGK